MWVLGIACGLVLVAGMLSTVRALWYIMSGRYALDQRLDSIGK